MTGCAAGIIQRMAVSRMAALVAPAAEVSLDAEINVPPNARVLVLVAEDATQRSDNSRMLAELPNPYAHATVRPDLRTADERARVDRLTAVLDWINRQPRLAGMPIGLLGVFGGASTALVTATRRPESVTAVACVCRDADAVVGLVSRVRAKTLLLVAEPSRKVAFWQVACNATGWLDEQLLHVVEMWRGH